jgi:hypothetical protein
LLQDFLILNLLLQAFDGLASYFILSGGADELNPLVNDAIEAWGLVWGLLFWKLFSCVLLFLLYSIRVYRPQLTEGALSFTAVIYSFVTVVLVWRLLEMFAL